MPTILLLAVMLAATVLFAWNARRALPAIPWRVVACVVALAWSPMIYALLAVS